MRFCSILRQVARTTTGIKKSVAAWAKSCAAEKNQKAQFGGDGGFPFGFGLAHKAILSKVQDQLGLNCARACFTAAAPISKEILLYFASLDITVYEIFGQSECTGPHTINTYGHWKIGTCGQEIPGVETKIDPSNGELCYRGRHIFMGYMKDPDNTMRTIDEDGWLRSGDMAKLDSDGFMSITGRIKELIITAGGENIPPVIIEDYMKETMPAISNCVVIGDRQKFLSMLITLKTKPDSNGEPTGELVGDSLIASTEIGSSAKTVEEAMTCPKWKVMLYITRMLLLKQNKT